MIGARDLLVVAIGGHALSSPAADATLAGERAAAAAAGLELARLATDRRLLLVHGNGPQVGRLLGDDASLDELDIRVAQTQGELGYLLASGLEAGADERVVALLTRVRVEAGKVGDPEKPIGPILRERPGGPHTELSGGRGWRRTVPSPLPLEVLECAEIRTLLQTSHVVAGGGGGVPVAADGTAVPGIVDKDRVAALLAIELGAAALVIGTDVDAAYLEFDTPSARRIERLSPAEAERLLAGGAFAPGSMAPKVASAAAFAAATGRPAVIAAMGQLGPALAGRAGTLIQN